MIFSLITVASEAFEDDNCGNLVSEDDSETQSVSSFSSGPTSPSEMPDQFPAVARPGSLDLPSPVSLSEFGMMFPILGPRSECSGASSPECEVERGRLQLSLCTVHAFARSPCARSQGPRGALLISEDSLWNRSLRLLSRALLGSLALPGHLNQAELRPHLPPKSCPLTASSHWRGLLPSYEMRMVHLLSQIRIRE